MAVLRPSKKGAAFLDRDGTVIRQVELMHEIGQMKLLSGGGGCDSLAE